MTQTRMYSLIEVTTSTAVGYGVAMLTQIIVFPWFDIEATAAQNAAIALIFTVVSIVRGYIFRRAFNWFSNNNKL
jgi:hypothetical protein